MKLFKPIDYYKEFIKEDFLNNFVPHKFESISMQYLEYANKNGILPIKLIDLYPYVYNDKETKQSYEFDVVGETKEGLINFECKYTNSAVSLKEIIDEQSQAKHVFKKFYKQAFISKSGFKNNISSLDYILITLDELFIR